MQLLMSFLVKVRSPGFGEMRVLGPQQKISAGDLGTLQTTSHVRSTSGVRMGESQRRPVLENQRSRILRIVRISFYF